MKRSETTMPYVTRNRPCMFFKGRNMMTPNVAEYGWLTDHIAYEISYGVGPISGTTIYGITIEGTLFGRNVRLYVDSQCVSSLAEAKNHVKTIAHLYNGLTDEQISERNNGGIRI